MADGTTQTPPKAEDPRYDAEYLARNVRSLIGSVEGRSISGPLLLGALARESRKTHTIDQAKAAVKRHLRAVADHARSEDDAPEEGEE